MDELDARYSRQILFPPIGRAGQEALARKKVGLVGLGALGATLAEMIVRAGVGALVAVDRDVVEASNLHRQGLYRQRDAEERLPKAEAARRALLEIAPGLELRAEATDFNALNARELFSGCDLILDGTDGFETRYLINDLAIELDIPWIYGACVAATGMTATIRPGKTPCLACLFPEPPPAERAETCDTSGIIAPAATITASLQVAEALKLLVGDESSLRRGLLSFELWPFRMVEIGARKPAGPREDCPACVGRERRWLDRTTPTRAVSLCGRDSVQILPGVARSLDLAELADRLSRAGEVDRNGFAVTLRLAEREITVFRDGRGLVRGTSDPTEARALYARYVGL
ncbi:MAG: ThiF family adenylyltransferase [Planctomycetota bacterium]